jgi:hypothetical protein
LNTYAYVAETPLLSRDPLGLANSGGGKSWKKPPRKCSCEEEKKQGLNISVGAGGGFTYGPIGASAESGAAIGSNGTMCLYTQQCGMFPAFGLAGNLGGSLTPGTGVLCSGETYSEGIFVSGGDGVYGGGQATKDEDGNYGVNRGFGGAGGGAAAGKIYCKTQFHCINESRACHCEK